MEGNGHNCGNLYSNKKLLLEIYPDTILQPRDCTSSYIWGKNDLINNRAASNEQAFTFPTILFIFLIPTIGIG